MAKSPDTRSSPWALWHLWLPLLSSWANSLLAWACTSVEPLVLMSINKIAHLAQVWGSCSRCVWSNELLVGQSRPLQNSNLVVNALDMPNQESKPPLQGRVAHGRSLKCNCRHGHVPTPIRQGRTYGLIRPWWQRA